MSIPPPKSHCRFSISNENSTMKRVKISQQNLVVLATPRVIGLSIVFVLHVFFSSLLFEDYNGRWIHE